MYNYIEKEIKGIEDYYRHYTCFERLEDVERDYIMYEQRIREKVDNLLNADAALGHVDQDFIPYTVIKYKNKMCAGFEHLCHLNQ